MALAVNPINDVETQRQKRNLTDSQKRNTELTKEGVVVNSLIKEPKKIDMGDLYDSMIISDNVKMPQKLHENKITQDKSLTPISIISVGVMGTVALISSLVKKSMEISSKIKPEKELDDLTRNISITNEPIQGLYQMVHCPNKKTILAGAGVIVIGALAFMGKMFMDGFKDIWVKKREADIQKNLQEKLIAVETQSFSGKIQIIRSMLSEKAKEFSEYICYEPTTPPAFKQFNSKLTFSGREEEEVDQKTSNFKYFMLGVVTLGSIVGLGFYALRNLGKGKKYLEEYISDRRKVVSGLISKSSKETKEADKLNLKKILVAIDSDPEYIKHELSKLKWDNDSEKEEFIDDVVFTITKSTTKADKAIGGNGTPKPAFNSYVNGDYKSFLYNYLLDTENPQFFTLFWGVAGLSALTYSGKVLGEGVKDVQVKKMNAQTELELQNRLVSTELRNFKAKKDAAINPLCEEFYTQVQRGKPKEELKVMADNILFEVKNGPPFVYS